MYCTEYIHRSQLINKVEKSLKIISQLVCMYVCIYVEIGVMSGEQGDFTGGNEIPSKKKKKRKKKPPVSIKLTLIMG